MTQNATQNVSASTPRDLTALRLEYPMTVASFTSYAEAQKAVDTLADQDFPVAQVAIVGSDLRQYERVLGRRTWGTVLLQGTLSGISTGLFVAIMLWLLTHAPMLTALVYGVALGVLFGLVFAALTYLATKGPRDFESITQTYALRYDVLAEHKVADQARQMLGVSAAPAGTDPLQA